MPLRRFIFQLLGTLLFGLAPLLTPVQAQSVAQTRFHHLEQEDINAQRWWRVFQSHDGFIWMTNASGLFRFNGYQAEQVPLNPSNTPGNQAYSILQTIEWPHGTFWMATANAGLLKFDMYTGACEIFQHDPDDSTTICDDYVTCIALDSSQLMWVGTPKGLNLFNPENGHCQRFFADPDDPDGLVENPITRMHVDKEGVLWLSHFKKGFSRYRGIKNGKIMLENFQTDPEDPTSYKGTLVTGFESYKPNEFWVGVPSAGLGKVEKVGDKTEITYFNADPDDPQAISDPSIIWMETDASDRLWIGTNVGVNCYSPDEDRFWQFYHDPEDRFSVGNNRLTHLYLDRQGLMWVTLYSSMDMISPFSHPIHNIKYDEKTSHGAPIKGVPFAVLKDSYDNLWIGTNKQGLMMRHGQTGKYHYFTREQNKPGGFQSPDVLDLIEDDQHRLWIATSHGLARVDLDTYFPSSEGNVDIKFHFYPYQKKGKPANAAPMRVIYDLEPDPRGGLWLATYTGISYFDTEQETFQNLIDSTSGYLFEGGNFYYQAALDQGGNLWLTTHQKGLKLLPAGAPYTHESFIHIRANASDPQALPSDLLKSVIVDSKNQVWVGSHEGLMKLDSFRLDTDTAFYFSPAVKNKKWPCSNVFEDKNGQIWYNTPKGFCFIKTDNTPGFEITRHDGLPANNSSLNTNFQDKDGNIYVGTGGGISIFHPDSLQPNLIPPKVAITGFQLFNKKVDAPGWTEPGTESEMSLSQNIAYLDELRLKHHQSVLTFEYAALNYYQSEKNQYAYMMEGFDRDWVDAGKRRSATYTNLDPGTYYFRVKACNNDGIWNEEGASLRIIVDPPWYRTWWAFVLYGMLITGFFGLYLYARVRKVAREYETQARIARAKVEERESVRKRSSRDFHDEAGNKLTKLSLYTELTKRKAAEDPEMLSFLGHIESNVRELATGMRDFIWVLDPEKDTLADTLNRLKDFGSQLFAHSDTAFSYKMNIEAFQQFPLEIKAKRHLLLIFKEAMNNCLKYAEADHATLEAFMAGDTLRVIFEDDGTGFDLENGRKGNGLKNMQSRATEMGGKVTYQSAANQGTQVQFEMQITRMGEGS